MRDERLEKLSERDEIEALLPWYVSGRLDAKSRARVERYIEAHPEVKAHLALAREEGDATIASNEAIAAPGRHVLDRLRASIAASTTAQASAWLLSQISDRFADWLCRLCAAAARVRGRSGSAHPRSADGGHRRLGHGACRRSDLSNRRRWRGAPQARAWSFSSGFRDGDRAGDHRSARTTRCGRDRWTESRSLSLALSRREGQR